MSKKQKTKSPNERDLLRGFLEGADSIEFVGFDDTKPKKTVKKKKGKKK